MILRYVPRIVCLSDQDDLQFVTVAASCPCFMVLPRGKVIRCYKPVSNVFNEILADAAGNHWVYKEVLMSTIVFKVD